MLVGCNVSREIGRNNMCRRTAKHTICVYMYIYIYVLCLWGWRQYQCCEYEEVYAHVDEYDWVNHTHSAHCSLLQSTPLRSTPLHSTPLHSMHYTLLHITRYTPYATLCSIYCMIHGTRYITNTSRTVHIFTYAPHLPFMWRNIPASSHGCQVPAYIPMTSLGSASSTFVCPFALSHT